MGHRIVVTGAGGQLGSVLARDLQKDHEVFGLTRESLDVADRAAVRDRIAKLRPTVVVNAAAYNDVDGAEEDPKAAFATNGFAVGALADAAAAAGSILVHFSSDFVFDGRVTRPYTEKDLPNPLSLYGASKLLGEVLAPRAPKHWILRLESVFGGEGGTSSIGKMADMLAKGEPVKAFYDRTVTPSYVDDVSRVVQRLLEKPLPWGLYHCVTSGMTTWHELAMELARMMGSKAAVSAVSMDKAGLKAPRPRYCALSNNRLADAGIELPDWRSTLYRFVEARGRG
ncbi:MAG: dTDP-4-dehydrorhamnose reductase [Thermoanaerobaculia bacterium]